MPNVTVHTPNIGLEAIFTFKEPISNYIRNRYNLDSSSLRLKVVSLISMGDIILNDMRDPYTSLYEPAGISESDYKKDLIDQVPLITFAFISDTCNKVFLRVPLNYLDSISDISNVEYQNKAIIIDLNRLPVDLDLTPYFVDIGDYVKTRIGKDVSIKEVSLGKMESVSSDEHELRESIRSNLVTVNKTNSIQLEELQLRYDELLNRLDVLGIVLG